MSKTFSSLVGWYSWAPGYFDEDWMKEQPGYTLSNGRDDVFWDIQVLIFLDDSGRFRSMVGAIEWEGDAALGVEGPSVKIEVVTGDSKFNSGDNLIEWNQGRTSWDFVYEGMTNDDGSPVTIPGWNTFPPPVILAHEIAHAWDYHNNRRQGDEWSDIFDREMHGMLWENEFRYAYYKKVPGYDWVDPRPAYGWSTRKDFTAEFGVQPHGQSALHPDIPWSEYPNYMNHLHPHQPYYVLE